MAHHYHATHRFSELIGPWRISGSNFRRDIFKHILWIKFISTSCEFALRCLPQNTFDDKSTLFRSWLGAVRQYDITWAIFDLNLCCHMASAGHIGLIVTYCITILIINTTPETYLETSAISLQTQIYPPYHCKLKYHKSYIKCRNTPAA